MGQRLRPNAAEAAATSKLINLTSDTRRIANTIVQLNSDSSTSNTPGMEDYDQALTEPSQRNASRYVNVDINGVIQDGLFDDTKTMMLSTNSGRHHRRVWPEEHSMVRSDDPS
jgi:hypothetical protein